MAKVECGLDSMAYPSVPRSVKASFIGCPAPTVAEVVSLAKSFPGLGVVAVRPSGRSFSGWVAVASFNDRSSALKFSDTATDQLLGEGCFCAVRSVRYGRRYRVSVPCLSLPLCWVVVRPSRPGCLRRSQVV